MMNCFRTYLLSTLIIGLLAPVAAAQSIEIRLNDGTRWRGVVGDHVEVRVVQRGTDAAHVGTIVNAADLWIQLQIVSADRERTETIFKGDIRSIRTIDKRSSERPVRPRVEPAETPSSTAPSPSTPTTAPQVRPTATERKADAPGVFLLPLSGMVGLQFRHEEIEAIAKHADEYGPGQIIVLEIDSDGGLVIEMEKIGRALREVKKRHRVVAWIRKAISAGAATAAFCDEIYFSHSGALGSMTMVAGGQAVRREEQMEWAQRAGEWFQDGGRSPYIAHAMILSDAELSYDKDPVTGRVTLYNNVSGEYILSKSGQNLTFNASNALHSGFAQGIADTNEDLAKLLDLPEWYEISDYGRRLHTNWVRDVDRAQDEIRRSRARMRYYQTGSGDQVAILGSRIQLLENIIRWAERVPNVAFFENVDVEQLRRQIAELRRELAEVRRQERNAGGRRR